MAVWMQIMGFRKSSSFEKEKEQITTILDAKNLNWRLKKHNDVAYFEFTFMNQELNIYVDNPDFIAFS